MSTDSAPPPSSATRLAVACRHCGLSVPPGLIEPGNADQFCCAACRTVYQAIHACGLESYYALRQQADAPSQRASYAERSYEEFDDPAFTSRHVTARPDGAAMTELYLQGVHCSACVWLVEKLPAIAPGVLSARLNMRSRIVQIIWLPDSIKLSRIARQLNGLGYPPHPLHGADVQTLDRLETRRHLVRIAIAGACAGNGMLAAIAMYAGDSSGMEDAYRHLLRAVSALIGLIALVWPGALFFRGAWSALRTRTPHMDLPIALGLLVGGTSGLINTLRGEGHVYFDSLAVLVLMLLIGRYIQFRQQRRADERIASLFALTPRCARRIQGDQVAIVPVEALCPGELVEIHPGESIPVDGIVTDGHGEVDMSLLTGESLPHEVHQGDAVTAGSVNHSRTLRVRVGASGDQTRLAKLAQLVADAALHKPRIVQVADRLSGWFVVAVTLIATATFIAWWPIDPTAAAEHATALLIVACPCALGIATPLALAVALGRCAGRSIFIKTGGALELLAKRGTIVLDKTGTLTCGKLSVNRWWGEPGAPALAAALERHSTHPVGRAIAASWSGELPSVNSITHQVRGVMGEVSGQSVVVGSPEFVGQHCQAPDSAREEIDRCLAAGQTPIAVGVRGQIVAVAWISDALREDAARSVEVLRCLGWKVKIASGDQQAIVGAIASQLGIDPADAAGNVWPEQKLELVRRLLEEDQGTTVVMVGDGVNDAAALAAASVGLAVHGGAEAALGAADAYFAAPGLRQIVSLFIAAQRTLKTIRMAMSISLAYNVTFVILAAMGLISPLIAAVLMPVSSFSVIATALARRTFKE